MINIEQLDTKSIKPYSNNNKLHDDKQIELLAKQIKEHGFDVPIVVDKDLTIIKGHGRLLAAKKLKLKQVPCIIRSDLNQNQIRAARIADNKLSESPWDTTNLLKELDELRLEDYDPQLVGFDSWDISTDKSDEEFKPTSSNDDSENKEPVYKLIIELKNDEEQQELFNELKERGFKVKAN